MRRALTPLAAVAAAAAVTAAITLPAGAQDGSGQDPALARFPACLSAHGVAVPSGLDGTDFKQWLGQQQDKPAVAAAVAACGSSRPPRGDAGFAALYACLTSHGVTVDDSPPAVKQKVLELNGSDAGRATLSACKVSVGDDGPVAKPAAACDGGPAGRPAQPAGKAPQLRGS